MHSNKPLNTDPINLGPDYPKVFVVLVIIVLTIFTLISSYDVIFDNNIVSRNTDFSKSTRYVEAKPHITEVFRQSLVINASFPYTSSTDIDALMHQGQESKSSIYLVQSSPAVNKNLGASSKSLKDQKNDTLEKTIDLIKLNFADVTEPQVLESFIGKCQSRNNAIFNSREMFICIAKLVRGSNVSRTKSISSD